MLGSFVSLRFPVCSSGANLNRLSYRDVEELLAERGLYADHVTVWRWVQRYAPEIQRRLRPQLRSTKDSWRVDETYIRLKGKWVYLYRAVAG
jgi:IS6 family transposase